jgi:hypothetical protein
MGYNADHAADVRQVAQKCKERKKAVVSADLGRKEIQNMSESEVEDTLWEVVKEICDDPDGLDPR